MAGQLPIDVRRVAILAMLSALDDLTAPPAPPRKRRLGTKRALLVGAGLVTAGRMALSPRARDLLEMAHERLAAMDAEWDPVEDDDDDDEDSSADETPEDDDADGEEDAGHTGAGAGSRARRRPATSATSNGAKAHATGKNTVKST